MKRNNHLSLLLPTQSKVAEALSENEFQYVGFVADFSQIGIEKGHCLKKKYLFYERHDKRSCHSILVVFSAIVYLKPISKTSSFKKEMRDAKQLIKHTIDMIQLQKAKKQKQLTIYDLLSR
ncbi:MAG: hypothetical protein AAGA60_10870 [Cyanobacteria bacterium P01_E01_bin.42]